MSFTAVLDRLCPISFFSSGSHLVQRSGTKIAIFKESDKMNISVKLFLKNLASGLGGDVN